MSPDEYAERDAIALSAAIRRGDTTAAEVTDAAIARIEQLNPAFNAVVMTNFDNARRFAAGGLADTPIAGAPFLLKDANQFSHDMPTTFSCRFFADAKPKPDGVMVSRWRGAGLNILGKTNTPEFAEDFVCEPTFRGVTLNPWNAALTTGGSSGGAGAAVAAGMVPIAHATDLGGSIRIPAACCGVFGLKPTSGLNPVGPYYPEISAGFNSDHVITRTVRDSAASLDATCGPVSGARYQVAPEVGSYLEALEQLPSRLRIGVCHHTPDGDKVGPAQAGAVDAVMKALKDLGHALIEYEFPQNLGLGSWMESLWMLDVAFEIEQRITETGREPEDHELEALTRFLRQHVAGMSAMDYYRARQGAHEAGVMLMNSMHDLDLVLTPALAKDPVPVGSLDSRTGNFDFDTWDRDGHAFAPFAYPGNVTGQPAASLPIQLGENQHPSAVQLAGHHRKDHVLLQVAAQLEQQFNWQDYRPPVWGGR